MTVQEIRKIAEARWEECHGCDANDKNFWMNGFITGYLMAEMNNMDDRIEKCNEKIADILINNQ
jgi:hypothetical protein